MLDLAMAKPPNKSLSVVYFPLSKFNKNVASSASLGSHINWNEEKKVSVSFRFFRNLVLNLPTY